LLAKKGVKCWKEEKPKESTRATVRNLNKKVATFQTDERGKACLKVSMSRYRLGTQAEMGVEVHGSIETLTSRNDREGRRELLKPSTETGGKKKAKEKRSCEIVGAPKWPRRLQTEGGKIQAAGGSLVILNQGTAATTEIKGIQGNKGKV